MRLPRILSEYRLQALLDWQAAVRCLGSREGIADPPLCCQQVQKSKKSFRTARAKFIRETKSLFGFGSVPAVEQQGGLFRSHFGVSISRREQVIRSGMWKEISRYGSPVMYRL